MTHKFITYNWNLKYYKDQKQELYLENKEDEIGEQLTFNNMCLFMGIK